MADKDFDFYLEDAVASRGGKWGKDAFDSKTAASGVGSKSPDIDDVEASASAGDEGGYKPSRKYAINTQANAEDAIVAAMTFLFSRYDFSSDSGAETTSFIDRIFEVIDDGISNGIKQSRKTKGKAVDADTIGKKMKSLYTRLAYNFNRKKASL